MIIDVAAGTTAIVNATLAVSDGLTTTGGGRVTVGGDNVGYSGGTTVDYGVLQFDQDEALGTGSASSPSAPRASSTCTATGRASPRSTGAARSLTKRQAQDNLSILTVTGGGTFSGSIEDGGARQASSWPAMN